MRPGTNGQGRRLFVAVPLPDEAVAAVAALVESVRAEGPQNGGREVRWVRLDGLHLTLRFLGSTPDDRVDATAAAVRSAAATLAPFEGAIGEAGAFPSPTRPRALWLGVQDGADRLADAASAVDEALGAAGWAFDDRPFRPHLTLARSDGVSAGPATVTRLVTGAQGLRIPFRVDRVGLFESITGGGPARYEPILVSPMGDTASSALLPRPASPR